MKKRIAILYLMIIFAFTALILRLSYVKIAYSEEYYYKALDLWTRTAPVEGRRGNIYDRNGTLIVGSTLAPTIVTIPKQVKDKEKTAQILSKILLCSKTEILTHLSKNVSVEIIKPSGRKISTEMAGKIAKENLAGIYIVGDTIRNYPYNHYLAGVLGIVGIDGQGLTGIEYIYDDYLKGKNGGVLIYTDAHGNTLADYNGLYLNATSGMDLYLTIDLGIQIALERVMDNAMSRYEATEIIGLVMNPQTAEIYGMASRPTFNPANYQDYPQELYNRNLTIWSSYEPGSTFKFVTFSAGLEEKVFNLEEMYYDPGYIMVDGARIKDWKAGGHGSETFLEVIQNSCNPGFVTIGLRLGKEKLFKYIKDYGFGTKTNIDLLGESTGILFNLNKVGSVELATTAFGQGISVTPIQLVTAASACINGGNLYQPYIVKALGIEDNYTFENEPTLIRQVISKETSDVMRYALESVVALGTGRSSFIEGYRVGGKTGSAQVAINGAYSSSEYILSFLGMAPMNNPEVVVYLAIRNPKNTVQYGGVVAAPLVKEILTECFSVLNISPQEGGIPLNARYWIDQKTYEVNNYLGQNVHRITPNPNYTFSIQGSGDIVLAQLPSAGELIVEGGTIILYT